MKYYSIQKTIDIVLNQQKIGFNNIMVWRLDGLEVGRFESWKVGRFERFESWKVGKLEGWKV